MSWYSNARQGATEIIRQVDPRYRRFRKIWPEISKIDGWLVPGQEWWLYKTAHSLPPNSIIVEIGSFKGRSTACLALGCSRRNGHVYAVDTFNGNDVDFFDRNYLSEFESNMRMLGLTESVTPIVMTSKEASEVWDKPINMLFIDGSHVFDDVVSDFLGFFPQVRDGGMVALHDVCETWPDVVKAWCEVAVIRLRRIGQFSTIAYGRKPPTGRRN